MPLSQDLYRVGYYIYTIDGPQVTVDYYADDHGNWKSDASYPNGPGRPDTNITPEFKFSKREIFGYSLNGKEFLISAERPPYSVVEDSYKETIMKILVGPYSNKVMDYNGRFFTQTVDTGWADNPGTFKSNVLSLWGMAKALGSDQTDMFVISLSYDPNYGGPSILMTKDANGKCVNAVDRNFGGTAHFYAGIYQSSYGLGAYGYDQNTHCAWAVINHNGNFTVAEHIANATE